MSAFSTTVITVGPLNPAAGMRSGPLNLLRLCYRVARSSVEAPIAVCEGWQSFAAAGARCRPAWVNG
jgi:hypothetical protein